MKIKTFLILITTIVFAACGYDTEKISGHAYMVDNFKDKKPLEGAYIEIEYTRDEGYNYIFLQGTTTDKNGYFKMDAEVKSGFFCIDCWAVANVYSDKEYSDTLGSFNFQFANNTYSYKTIHLDTFSMPHKIWVIPKISNLGDYQPDEISITFFNCELVDKSQENITHTCPVYNGQTFPPVEIVMSMNIQHWLSYGTREFARGCLKKDSKEIGYGYFKLEPFKRTVEGDTVYIDFKITKPE